MRQYWIQPVLLSVLTFSFAFSDRDEQFCRIDHKCDSSHRDKLDAQHDENQEISHKAINSAPETGCLRAAVLELNRYDSDDCKSSAKNNLDLIEKATKLAAKNGAQMIVTPEDGIFGAFNRSYIAPCLEEIPDPEENTDKNPCLQVESFKQYEILRRLSCIARESKMYVIANYGSKRKCNPNATKLNSSDGGQHCPKDGFVPLNTDVVLDPQGNYIKRYRKWNIFIESFSKAPVLEHTYFDTPFGRFGLFTCFDILFKSPAVDLVEEYNIDGVIFPTLWYDELPLLSAIQFQDAWSRTNKVDLLASNILRPNSGTTGSSIFSGLDSVYVGPENRKSRVILANLRSKSGHQNGSSSCEAGFHPQILDLLDQESLDEAYSFKNYDFLDKDSLAKLQELAGEKTVCAVGVCCTIDYELEQNNSASLSQISSDPNIILIARNLTRKGYFRWHEQVCSLATTKDITQTEKGPVEVRYNPDALVAFKRLSLSAVFDTNYVYPIAAHNASMLLARTDHKLVCEELKSSQSYSSSKQYYCQMDLLNQGKPTRLYSFGMYARPYDMDAKPMALLPVSVS